MIRKLWPKRGSAKLQACQLIGSHCHTLSEEIHGCKMINIFYFNHYKQSLIIFLENNRYV
jgi:hypothetical protein